MLKWRESCADRSALLYPPCIHKGSFVARAPDFEDGVEENNTVAYNLIAHVHYIGDVGTTNGQYATTTESHPDLVNPADITASAFYISNLYNTIIGNAASGGWAGFAIPMHKKPVGPSSNFKMTPEARPTLRFSGNSAHSSGFWYAKGGALITIKPRLCPGLSQPAGSTPVALLTLLFCHRRWQARSMSVGVRDASQTRLHYVP